MVTAVWDLVWAGLLTNDTLGAAAGAAGRRPGGAAPAAPHAAHAPRGRYAQLRAGRPAMPSRTGPPSVGGRWSLAVAREPDPTRRAHARAEAFLERHGVLTRGALGTERVTGGFAGVYRVLRAMEDSGRARRGYVVEGLGAAQFAVPGAIDRLRALSAAATERLRRRPVPTGPAVAATPAREAAFPRGARRRRPGPALRCGAGLAGHRRRHQAPARAARPARWSCWSRGPRCCTSSAAAGRCCRSPPSATSWPPRRRRWPAPCTRAGSGTLAVERADGVGSLGSELAEVLTEAGFRVTPKGLRLRA